MPDDDSPNVIFGVESQPVFQALDLLAQAEVIAIASWLYAYPTVDGETKFLIPGPQVFGVKTYRRVYVDGPYEIVYDFDDYADPPTLTVLEIRLARGDTG